MELSKKCKQIKFLLTDVDGVLTDGRLWYTDSGELMKSFNVKDGLICKKLLNQGIEIGIITGRTSDIVAVRAKELGIKTVYQGQKDKVYTLSLITAEHGLSNGSIAYIGDDLNDLPVLKNVGLSACPADAIERVLKEVDYICRNPGGEGAFREFADLILDERNDK